MNEATDTVPVSDGVVRWDDDGQTHEATWRSAAGYPAPTRVKLADDRISADAAYRLMDAGTSLLWCGDFQNARHLLQALQRRVDARQAAPAGASADQATSEPGAAFLNHRQAQGRRAALLNRLLLPFDADHGVPLRRAPDARRAVAEAHGKVDQHYVGTLRELLGLIGAHEWRKKGVAITALDARIHPHHGVFSPVRGEYVDLVAQAPLPLGARRGGAFDIGTGTGVLAAVLARRGVEPITATDIDPRALACAKDNLARLKLGAAVRLLQADLFPPGRAALVVCNPPWVPAAPATALDASVYDPDSRMLRGFLSGLAAHLAPKGEGWLILSDLAEHLGLRSAEQLEGWIAAARLKVVGRIDTLPRHGKVQDPNDPLHRARAAEVTSLWRLVRD